MQRQQYAIKQRHEANSLRVALKMELLANRDSFERRVEQFEGPVEFGVALVQNRSNDKIYNELLSSIGLLTEQEVEKVTQAYSLLDEIPYRIKIVVSTGTEPVRFNEDFITIPKGHQDTVLQMHKMAIPTITQAIDEINAHLKSA